MLRLARRDVYAIMRGWYESSRDPDTPLSARHLGKYFGEFITAIRENHSRGIPPDDAQIVDFTRMLLRKHRVDDATAKAMRFGDQRPRPLVVSGASTTPPVDARAVASELESTVSDMSLTGIES